jgi:DNA-binding LacI/PurR family transcriptional regulator
VASSHKKIRRCTQASIARELRFSQTLVSQVLNGKKDQFKPETYARIWAHALASGYRGTGITMDIAPADSRRRDPIGIVHATLGLRLDPFFASVQWATEELLAERGIPVIQLGTIGRMRDRVLSQLSLRRVPKPALIIMGEVPLPLVAELAARSPRIATVGWASLHVAPAVLNNDAESVELLLRRLKRAGHTHVVWFGRILRGAHTEAPFVLTDIAARVGIRLRVEDPFISNTASPEEGRRAARALLQNAFPSDVKPTAVLCSDLSIAKGAIDSFNSARIDIPNALSIAAIGCPEAAEHDSLRITSACSASAQMAAAIVELLLGNSTTAGSPHQCILPPAQLFIGNTDGPCAANYPPRRLPSRAARPLRAA